jgi:hypothetical protein
MNCRRLNLPSLAQKTASYRIDSAILLDPDTLDKRPPRDTIPKEARSVLAPPWCGMTIAAEEAGCPSKILAPGVHNPGFHNAALHPIDLLIDLAGAAGTIAA